MTARDWWCPFQHKTFARRTSSIPFALSLCLGAAFITLKTATNCMNGMSFDPRQPTALKNKCMLEI
jgi:hypothetical protein